MKRILVVLAIAVAVPAFGSISINRSPAKPRTLDVRVAGEPLSVALKALEMYLPAGVELATDSDPMVALRADEIAPVEALRRLVAAAGLVLRTESDRYTIRDVNEPAVTLDVKDADARAIFKSMQKQCGIRNLMIDPHVQGSGTFLFHDLPCRTAFSTVLRSLGLTSVSYSNSVVAIEPNTR